MHSAIVIGPLMLAVDRGLAILCMTVFLGLSALAERFSAAKVSTVATTAIVAELIAARIGCVAMHRSSYAEAPVSILMVWQGGYNCPYARLPRRTDAGDGRDRHHGFRTPVRARAAVGQGR